MSRESSVISDQEYQALLQHVEKIMTAPWFPKDWTMHGTEGELTLEAPNGDRYIYVNWQEATEQVIQDRIKFMRKSSRGNKLTHSG